ncbi:unnamed protein product [Rangifer tarandus platyrhynchus]|uniref:Uncharacterized protein n=1 Tax=Rangifer tarandus platyrhynchus TaxID=3082113 RepID=A0ABN8YPA2_RANTA|nr:unnamed protein product [Rangifer tarandus platyrhynchus]
MTERLHFHFSLSCTGEGNGPTPVFLPGESQGRGSLVGCRLWGRTESTRLKRLSSSSSTSELLPAGEVPAGIKAPSGGHLWNFPLRLRILSRAPDLIFWTVHWLAVPRSCAQAHPQRRLRKIWILDRENPNTSEYCQLVAKLGHLISEPYLYLQKLEDSDMENSENFDMGFIQESLVYLLCVYCIPSGML